VLVFQQVTESVKIVRIVVASPSDVRTERDAVAFVADELNQSMCADRGLRLEVARWETDTYPGFHPDGPQGLIDPILKIEDCDLLIGIFWKRFGSPTKYAASGTEHEFRTAYEAWQVKRRPQVMMYFSQKPHTPQSKEETDQWGKVLEFRKVFPEEGLWWPYKGSSSFTNLLRRHLSNFIRAEFSLDPREKAASSVRPIFKETNPNYFAVQSRLIEEYTSTFVGRARVKEAIQRFLATQRRGYLIVRGAPGQGKTALLCDLVRESQYVHHFISRSGGRADSRLILGSLVSQLLSAGRLQDKIPESVPELTKTFEELLADASSRREKTVVVIDALDELPGSLLEEPFLAVETIPDRVYFIVSCRPGERLDRLQTRLFAVPRQVLDLGPLNTEEVRDLLRPIKPDMSAADVERVTKVSQGNPLYLQATATQMQIDRTYNLQSLPPSIEDFFGRATSSLGEGNAILRDVLSLLSAARISLSVSQLSEIMHTPQRDVFEQGVRPIRPYLFEIDGGYLFYHSRFQEYLLRTVLFQDELRASHRKIAQWLQRAPVSSREYRLSSLTYHLFESGENKTLIETIDEHYLDEKVRRLGYAVLEDVELWTRALLILEDPALVGRCVSLVESLRQAAGDDILPDAVHAIHSHRDEPANFRMRLLEPETPQISGLDMYVGILPQAQITADFIELVPMESRLVMAIGDAPSVGLRSAFVARFLGNLFSTLVERGGSSKLDKVLGQINATVRGYEYFERVSMQCADIDAKGGLLRIANAGHPFPVRYSLRQLKSDVLPLRGELINDPYGRTSSREDYEEYALKIESGDVIVFITDGITEDHVIHGDPYGYRFTKIVEAKHKDGARAIGEAILDDWKAHPREEDAGDDVSLVVITVGGRETNPEQAS
jgi:serine phosphatase RsbU (regulator of sigma subunit)